MSDMVLTIEKEIFEFAVEDPEETIFGIISLGNGVEVLESWDLISNLINIV
jgi:hypothetical protein